jgi:acyl-CoA synthetase (AMP-forming)/AMP-acid ligase II
VTTLAGLLRWRARRHPDLAAVAYEGRYTTYEELDGSSSRLAAGLVEKLGVRPGDRIAILDKNSDRYLALIFAIAKAGAVMVPVNWRLRAPEVAQVVGNAEPVALVTSDEFRASTTEVTGPVLGFDEVPEGDADPGADIENGVAWQLYTSGTTGLPKGARLTSRNLFAMVFSLGLEMPELVEGSASLALSPLYHIGGSGWALLALAHGATCVMVRDVVPERLADILITERVATGLIVPAVLQSLANLNGIAARSFDSLRNIAYGASPIAPTLLEQVIEVFGTRVTQLYGLTETTGAVTALRHDDHVGDRLLSCGRAMLGGQVRVVDGDGQPLPPGDVGEIVYRGASLMAGYWKRPDDTAAAIRGGWFHTGDAGMLDGDGFLFIRDRIKDVIVSGGENVYPAELEAVLGAHPEVLDVAVIGVPDERWGETVKAVVARRPGSRVGETELIEWCRPRLAGYKRPRSVDFADVIPRNPSGKILKHELRESYWTGETRRVH